MASGTRGGHRPLKSGRTGFKLPGHMTMEPASFVRVALIGGVRRGRWTAVKETSGQRLPSGRGNHSSSSSSGRIADGAWPPRLRQTGPCRPFLTLRRALLLKASIAVSQDRGEKTRQTSSIGPSRSQQATMPTSSQARCSTRHRHGTSSSCRNILPPTPTTPPRARRTSTPGPASASHQPSAARLRPVCIRHRPRSDYVGKSSTRPWSSPPPRGTRLPATARPATPSPAQSSTRPVTPQARHQQPRPSTTRPPPRRPSSSSIPRLPCSMALLGPLRPLSPT